MVFVIGVFTWCGMFDMFLHIEGTPGLHLQGVFGSEEKLWCVGTNSMQYTA